MSPRVLLPVSGLLAIALTSAFATSRSGGILPGELLVPPGFSSNALPACGHCHDPLPNANGVVTMAIAASALSLSASATISMTAKASGGPLTSNAGFLIEADFGTFVAGTSSRVSMTGNGITHTDQLNDSWTFGYTAPATPGVVQITGVTQKVNLDLQVSGDSFGFYGPNSAVPGVPLRLYVNAANAKSYGDGCKGADGHVPVLGASSSPVLGTTLNLDVVAMPASTFVFCAIGGSNTVFGALPLPFDLALINAPGCFVRASYDLMQSGLSTGSGSGGGAIRFGWPVPNTAVLAGLHLYAQALAVDPAANQLGLTTTNALDLTLL